MASISRQLKKVRRLSLREIGVRGRQEIAKLKERVFRASTVEMSDGAFLREFRPESRNCSGEGSAALIAGRIDGSTRPRNVDDIETRHHPMPFLQSLSYRDEIRESMLGRFVGQREQLIDRAERALAGRSPSGSKTSASAIPSLALGRFRESGRLWSIESYRYLNAEVAGDGDVGLNRHGHS
jgi:hypothetical protein